MATSTVQLNRASSFRWSALFIAFAVAIFLLPHLSTVMIYDRSAILNGEIWRLFTGHWVHFSAGHLLCDVSVLGMTALLIESRGYRYFPTLCLLSAFLISLVMLVFLPDMSFYGGLSGIAMASIVYLALNGLREAGPWRHFCLGILLMSVGKLVFDVYIGHFTLVAVENEMVRPAPLSHLIGAITGTCTYLYSEKNRIRISQSIDPRSTPKKFT